MNYIKGSVQRKLRWVKSGVIQWVCVPHVTMTYNDVASEDQCKWLCYRHMIYSPETNMTLILISVIA